MTVARSKKPLNWPQHGGVGVCVWEFMNFKSAPKVSGNCFLKKRSPTIVNFKVLQTSYQSIYLKNFFAYGTV